MKYASKLLAPVLALGLSACATITYVGPRETVKLYVETTDEVLANLENKLNHIRSYQLETGVLEAQGKDVKDRGSKCSEMKNDFADQYNQFARRGHNALLNDAVATTPGLSQYDGDNSGAPDFTEAQKKVGLRLETLANGYGPLCK